MDNIEILSADLAKATDIRDTFKVRLPGAEAALSAAKEHRAGLVHQTARGAVVADKTLRDAGLNIAAAESNIGLLVEQIAEAEAAVARATQAHGEAVQAANDKAVADAQRAVIAAGDNLTRLGAAYGAGADDYHARYVRLFDAMSQAGRVPTQTELEYFQRLAARIPSAIPASIQQPIVQRDTVVFADLGQVERQIWLRGATPDDEADAPYNEKERLHAAAVESQQAYESIGWKQAERARLDVPSFTPSYALTEPLLRPRVRTL